MGAGLHTFEIQIPPRLLVPTTYLLSITSTIQFTGDLEHYQACCEFTLRDLSNPVHQRTGVLECNYHGITGLAAGMMIPPHEIKAKRC